MVKENEREIENISLIRDYNRMTRYLRFITTALHTIGGVILGSLYPQNIDIYLGLSLGFTILYLGFTLLVSDQFDNEGKRIRMNKNGRSNQNESV